MAAVAIRGTTYPVVLPKLRDPRLHLAATIISLQVLGQVAFDFKLSIAQILVCLGTVAVLEITITFFKQHILMWPASALLTGNGVAFVLRVPGTQHGDWWSMRGWWIYAATAAGSLLSKYVIAWRGEHVFNPSNIGLVAVFLLLGRTKVEPLDFWWGPMSWWMAVALAIIVSGGFIILRRLKLLRVALSFWAAFAVGIGVLALAGHAMVARWHLGPITGFSFWWVLVTSPEVLVFLFFMITDPKTAPRGPRARIGYGLALGILAALLIAPTTTEFAAKVALLSSLAVVCVVKALFWFIPVRVDRTRVAVAAVALATAFAAVVALADSSAPSVGAQTLPRGTLPAIEILPSPGVQTQLDRPAAERIAYGLLAVHPARSGEHLRVHLVPGTDQSPPSAVAELGSATYRLHQDANGTWVLAAGIPATPAAPALTSTQLAGERLTNVAPAVGLDFTQGSFAHGVTNDAKAMMGGGVCWIDYNGDGRLDLFAVNSFSSGDATGPLPTSALFENRHGTFTNVSAQAHAALAAQGDGCVAADLNGDGHTDLVVTTTSGVELLWNDGHGHFTRQSLPANGWYTGATVSDVNGDGRPDLFVAGYSDLNRPVTGSYAGFPTNVEGVRDLLFLNRGGHTFREVGVQAGIEAAAFRHGLGALFTDVNGDGRPDLYVANDEDPNQLYVNVPWPGGAAADPACLGFRFEERGVSERVADPFAGMGVATTDGTSLFVTNSRGEPSAAFRRAGAAFRNARPLFSPALGSGFAGWGVSWVDLENTGTQDLALTAGAIPVKNLVFDAEPVRILAPAGKGYGDATAVLGKSGLKLNGRGLAAADAFNDGRTEIAVNTIGGRLVLLRPTGPSGHWLGVALSRFVPGAVVTVTRPDGSQQSRAIQAGSSYLSSEDPRAHFGLGPATRVGVTVRYPWGAVSRLGGVRSDQVLTVSVPAFTQKRPVAEAASIAGCRPLVAPSATARYWNDMTATMLERQGTADPVQARDLYDLSVAIDRAYRAESTTAARAEAIDFAAYRLLLWQASYGAGVTEAFATLTSGMRRACLQPSYTATDGASPAATGNRIAAAAIASGLHDGSNELLHYADPSYTAPNAPLVVGQAGSAVHDATFWQPLALAQVSPRGGGAVPAKVQTFVGSQWGGVRRLGPAIHVPAPALGDPSGKAYRAAALAVIRATAAAHGPSTASASPAAWNLVARGPASLARDVRLDLALNGALNDAAVAVYGAKRRYETPRPIEMIRYLAFNGTLPIVPGLTRKVHGQIQVRLAGRWVRGDRWTPPAHTPASPGYPSAAAAYAYAASSVLPGLDSRAAAASAEGVRGGVELPGDAAAGRRIGLTAGRRAAAGVR